MTNNSASPDPNDPSDLDEFEHIEPGPLPNDPLDGAEEAQRQQLASAPVPSASVSGVAALEAYLAAHHAGEPQRAYLAKAALDAIKAGLAHLAALGHRFDLVEHDPPPPVEFPKMYYHDTMGHITVHSQAEANALSPGWRDTPRPRTPEPSEAKAEAEAQPESPPPTFTPNLDGPDSSGFKFPNKPVDPVESSST